MKKHISLSLIALFISASLVVAQKRETRTVGTFTKISFGFPGKLILRQGSPQKVELEGTSEVLERVDTELEGDRLVITNKRDWKHWGDGIRVTAYVTVEKIDGINVSGSGDVIAETKITSDQLELRVSGSGSLEAGELDVKEEIDANVSGSGNIDIKGKCKNFDSNVSGSGHVNIAGNISEKADFSVSGSGKIGAEGTASSVKVSISGSGKVLAANLETNKCNIHISGSGNVEINVKDDLDAHISGSGSVSYKGNPSHVNSDASGSGSIRKM
ncbi:MAG TPA: head GIN domain-containing protein [Cyclobacteriaceae bacterium]|nr:head GIN domain-containing protein [Cyclobacteriaceae bacterium]